MSTRQERRKGGGRRREGGAALTSLPPQFLVILLSELFVQRTLDAVATAGTVTVMLFGWAYAKAR